MDARIGRHGLAGAAVVAALLAGATSDAAAQPARASWQVIIEGGRTGQDRGGYERGYREGLREGERDGRARRAADAHRHGLYRNGDAGYAREYGSRGGYQRAFRNGFEDGYREGFERARVTWDARRGANGRRNAAAYLDAAAARGYSDGFEHGVDDARDRDRYDPVRHGDYRDGDNGYDRRYGNRDSYAFQYRTGFRQGYDDGYRSSGRRW